VKGDKSADVTFNISPLTFHAASRIRWDCRRGMLELDIVLARFLEQDFARLNSQEVETFRGLLAYPDTELWGLIQSETTSADADLQKVLQLLRQN
jgi:antitoxin CptB